MLILGISAFYHDSATCLIQDGEIIAAAQEERFTRIKHDSSFPQNAIHFCLNYGKISSDNLDYIAFYDKPFIKFDRILETYLSFAPKGLTSFLEAMPVWLKQKLFIKASIGEKLNCQCKVIFPEHHESHAASAFFPSPYKEAAIITFDGVGEWATTSFGIGKENKIKILEELHFPHSLGLLYSAFSYYLGFKVNSGEYKMMGLAPYGKPKYRDLIFSELIDLKTDGSFRLNMKYFGYCSSLKMINAKFEALFGLPARKPENKLEQKHMDIARSIQEVTEEIMLLIAQHAHKVTGQENLCLAGGVALNCVSNGRLLREGPFKNIWIQPAAGDAGGALGAALFVWYQYLGNSRVANNKEDFQKGSFLGPQYSDDEIEKYLIEKQINYKKMHPSELLSKVADLIIDQKVVGWFQGRMEFGPRALGARSILGDPRSPKMQGIINLKIKFRESFRPFAPSILRDNVADYFENDIDSPYMLLTVNVKSEKRIKISPEEDKLEGIEKLNIIRSEIPAVTHVDYSARIQTVSENINPLFYGLLKVFNEKCNCSLMINTSFNVRGEPIVCTPEDAYRCFMNTNMDCLVLGSFILEKED